MVLLAMIFCHIVDDYYLQGWLASAKQKKYWRELPNYTSKYRFDYIAALLMHAFSWTFMVMLPIGITIGFNPGVKFYVTFLVNFLVHAVTDNGKANAMKLNLVQDQAIHILQILVTFLVFHL